MRSPPVLRFDDPTGPRILLALRDGGVRSWAQLCRVFGYDPHDYHSGHLELRDLLEDLSTANLIDAELHHVPGNRSLRGKLSLRPQWGDVCTALGISLKELSKARLGSSMLVSPIFGVPEDRLQAFHVFALMPFRRGFLKVYEAIRDAARKCSLRAGRADDIFSTRAVMEGVWTSICNARMLVADCTSRNPNVFYEMGIAHTLGKSVVLITQDRKDVPVDVVHIRYIRYANTPSGRRDLESDLVSVFEQELGLDVDRGLRL